MKILIGMPAKDSWGGPARCEPPFVEALKAAGVEVETSDYVYGDKEKPTPLTGRVRRVLKTAFRFRRLLKSSAYDLVHLNTAFDARTVLRDTISLFIMQPRKAKVFLKLHGSDAESFQSLFRYRILIAWLKRMADGFGVLSSEEIKTFEQFGFDTKKFFLVKNAVSFEQPDLLDLPREVKNVKNVFELLFVARFIETKGLLETIEACARLRRVGLRVRLTCVGDGPLRPNAEAEVERLGLQNFVTFTGYVDEARVEQYMAGADIFVFPTRHPEGFPIALFKAVVAGLPVVTTATRAAADYLTNRENGIFCNPDAQSVADAVETLIRNPELMATIRETNSAMRKNFSPETIAGGYIQIYRKLIDGSPFDSEIEKANPD